MAVWKGQKTWNGVATLARGTEPVLIRDALPGDPDDEQSRYTPLRPSPESAFCTPRVFPQDEVSRITRGLYKQIKH